MLWLRGRAGPLGLPGKLRAADAARAADDSQEAEVTASPFFQDGVLSSAKGGIRTAYPLSRGN